MLGRYTCAPPKIGISEVVNTGKQVSSQKVEVTDLLTNRVSTFVSVSLAAKSLGVLKLAFHYT